MRGITYNKTILCVDDEDGILDFYRQWLTPGNSDDPLASLALRRVRRKGGSDEAPAAGTNAGFSPGQYNLITARSGEEAIEKIQEIRAQGGHIAVGFFDMKMPGGMDGFETIKAAKRLDPNMLVAVVTAYHDRALSSIASVFQSQDEWIYFNKPFTHNELVQATNHLTYGWNIRRERERAFQAVELNNQKLISTIVKMLDVRDPYTAGHSHRTASFGRLIGERMGMTTTECDRLYLACLLHDIGKVGVDDSVLRKPDKLNRDEYEHIKRHSILGYEILQSAGMDNLSKLVRHHHERMDGNGYPDRLFGSMIPREARILAVADTFDALTSTRSYREAKGIDAARSVLMEIQGTQHDPDISRAFVSVLDEEPQLVIKHIAPEAIRAAHITDPAVCPMCEPAPQPALPRIRSSVISIAWSAPTAPETHSEPRLETPPAPVELPQNRVASAQTRTDTPTGRKDSEQAPAILLRRQRFSAK